MSGFAGFTEPASAPWVRMRRALRASIWPSLSGEIPQTIPTAALNANVGYKAAGFDPNCVRLDRLTCSLPLGGVSTVDLLYPANPINVCVIAGPGHGMNYYTGNQPGVDVNAQYMVMGLLAAGCHVLGPGLPAFGFDAIPYALTGGLQITSSHVYADMQAIAAAGVQPLVYFLEPWIQAINYVFAQFAFTRLCATGLSGGGMMTEYASAVDTRIKRSVPVFGSMIDAFNNPGGLDGEQRREWGWYTSIGGDLTNLGVLGALETDRTQRKYWGSVEPVFPVSPTYNGHSYAEVQAAYAPAETATGNRWSYVLDTNPAHGYSTATIAAIVSTFAA